MPGVKSLEKIEYYAHPQNQFWRILFTVFEEFPIPTDFNAKVEFLHRNNIALWDVLQACDRQGSLDSNIKNHIPNDIPSLLEKHPNISKILFNGKDSHRYFAKAFGEIEELQLYLMPSTSPAYTLKFDEKLQLWREALLA